MLNRMNQKASVDSSEIYNIMIPERSDLRIIKKKVNFSFIYKIVEPYYSEDTGRPSYDPVRLIKMEYLKIRYNVLGDEELLAEISDRASFRDFLGLELGEGLPDRTTLVKFRTQIGAEVINQIFDEIIEILRKADMIGDKHTVFDATNTKADARIVATRDKIYKNETIDTKKKMIQRKRLTKLI